LDEIGECRRTDDAEMLGRRGEGRFHVGDGRRRGGRHGGFWVCFYYSASSVEDYWTKMMQMNELENLCAYKLILELGNGT
jgi:hypothetical protein